MEVPPKLATTRPVRPAGSGPRLRAATMDDYEQIARLETRHELPAISREDWSHLWIGNPAFHDGWEPGWVVEDARGAIVASVGNIPLSYEFGGRPVITTSGRALVADEEYRSATTLLLSRVIHQPSVELYLNNTITAMSAPSFGVFECPRVPAGQWDQAAFWIIDHQAFLKTLFERRGVSPALRWSAGAIAPFSKLRDRMREKKLARSVEVIRYDNFDDRFDTFWWDFRDRHRDKLLAVRSSAVLRWHFAAALKARKLWIAAVIRRGSVAAYAIFDRKDNSKVGLKRVRLVDFVALDGTTALLAPILRWAIDQAETSGVHMLESTGQWLDAGDFMNIFAPHRRKLATWTYFYRSNQSELAAKLTDRRMWSPSAFDGNASL